MNSRVRYTIVAPQGLYFNFRVIAIVPVNWVFILICVILRLLEGVGTALVGTSIFSALPYFFPKSVGTLMVCDIANCI